MSKTIRIPKQKRSIQKKEAILQSAFILFSQQGYFNTDTAQIAKHANVSTGILYNYFQDKHDILNDVVTNYINNLENNLNIVIEKHQATKNLSDFINDIYQLIVDSHHTFSKAQNQFNALALLDESIGLKFNDYRKRQITTINQAFFNSTKQNEMYPKLLLAFELIEKISHLYVSTEITKAQFEIMKQNSIAMILSLL